MPLLILLSIGCLFGWHIVGTILSVVIVAITAVAILIQLIALYLRT